ncbi:zf-HC2 domain-containing protein [Streptomyces sp. NBC_01696]|jgi:anti-sigma factor RsiW|uniref:Zf-HC2 domain-containing protein n=1 Tax=Streptomyces sp. gb1(2016) TaxID=1828321 RepID=A0A652LC54_9ACTN|nr:MULTISPECIES: zf-HC2 domain-containing protein [unclassified Streptomyces]WSS65863.1 zf-HC2 domain-containing protein [Streptomyces sp. NBC_01177]WSS79895.1 zf-HC2 domain-containing protein [Streptomyces sp. NBC_01174]MDX3432071.1 zf-HC2 domain-containing protein [Streptomyces sp. ME01-18a]MDX3685506.1 zf-HC2 domain-containing protein [Streptomyces sp. AK04-4c]TXS33406.1 zf-HC2 domain-containing protein [Streptomyces sp. gb1(2016)]
MTADRGEEPHVRQLLGAYVLDALEDGESAPVARHLQRCGACAAAYVEVAEAVSLLALLNLDDLLE